MGAHRAHRGAILAAWLGCTVVAAACGGGTVGAPTAPSASPGATSTPPPTATAGSGTATIAGSVALGSTAASSSAGWSTREAGLTVVISGTSISSPIDERGGYRLDGVPSGDVEVRFRGNTVDAGVRVSEVKRDERIELDVAVSGSTAEVRRISRSDGNGDARVHGRVDERDPVARTFTVNSRLVRVTDTTTIRNGSQVRVYGDITIGDVIEARGTYEGDVLVAQTIEVMNQQGVPIETDTTVSGPVAAMGGACPNLGFRVRSSEVQTDANTVFADIACAEIRNGTWVEVEGTRNGVGLLVAASVERAVKPEDDDDDDDDDDEEDDTESGGIEFTDILSSVSGTATAGVLVVGGRTVHVISSTSIEFRGKSVAFSELKAGQRVLVKGTKQADGSTVASIVKILN